MTGTVSSALHPQMATQFLVSRGECLCWRGSSLQGIRQEFPELVRSGSRGSVGSWHRQGVVCMATKKKTGKERASKEKGSKEKASREKRKARRSHGWSFDALMLVWDEIFDRCCENGGRATTLRKLAKSGLERFGSGCVLVQETVRTLPRGSASGFSSHARHSSSKNSDEPPAYETLTWTAQYVPRTFVLNPSLAPEAAAAAAESSESSVVDITNQVIDDVPLVTREILFSVLRGMDRTRIMGLTGDTVSSVPVEDGPAGPVAADAGGEAPYDPRNEEIVLMLVVMVDGQPAVGADVVRALPTSSLVEDGLELWKLEMRDFHTLPVPA